MSQDQEKARLHKPATFVRFSEKEFNRIQEDSIKRGKSIQALLREKYFNGSRPLPLVSKEDLAKYFDELHHIGDLANDLARRVNSGIGNGLTADLQELQRRLKDLWMFMSQKYCRCRGTSLRGSFRLGAC